MHDLDRTQRYQETEFEPEMYAYEDEGPSYEGDYEFDPEASDEVEEMELAANLLEITDEAELDQFLGGIIKKVKSGVGRQLGGILKGVARTALPMVGGALGSFVAPGVGTVIGRKLGSAAGGLFGLELEGLSPQDQEYEVARRFVRLGQSAVKKAQQLQSTFPPDSAARKAVIDAARKHAPGLLQVLGGIKSALGGFQFEAAAPQGIRAPQNGGVGGGRSGRWIRRGRKIILIGV